MTAKVRAKRAIGVGAAVVLIAAAMLGTTCSTALDNNGPRAEMQYTIGGASTDTVIVTYTTHEGSVAEVTDPVLPWEHTEMVPLDTEAVLSVSAMDTDGVLDLAMFLRGEQVASARLSGAGAKTLSAMVE